MKRILGKTPVTRTPYIEILDWEFTKNRAYDTCFRYAKHLCAVNQQNRFNVMVEYSRSLKRWGIYLVYAD